MDWLLKVLVVEQGTDEAAIEGHADQRWWKRPAENHCHQHQGLPCPLISGKM